jgi:RNA polymerase sigma-70 factor (ECF subfamily)
MLSSRRRQPLAASELDDQWTDDSPDLQAAQNLAEEVQLALQRIRSEYREAFVLFHENGLNYEQIAQVLTRPVGTIKTWVRRARQELVALLQQREVVGEMRYELRRV